MEIQCGISSVVIIKRKTFCSEDDPEDSEKFEYTTDYTTPLFQSDSETSFKYTKDNSEPTCSKTSDPIDYDSYSRVFDQVESENNDQSQPLESHALADYAEFLKEKLSKRKLQN